MLCGVGYGTWQILSNGKTDSSHSTARRDERGDLGDEGDELERAIRTGARAVAAYFGVADRQVDERADFRSDMQLPNSNLQRVGKVIKGQTVGPAERRPAPLAGVTRVDLHGM
jgi:hypothetical protein